MNLARYLRSDRAPSLLYDVHLQLARAVSQVQVQTKTTIPFAVIACTQCSERQSTNAGIVHGTEQLAAQLGATSMCQRGSTNRNVAQLHQQRTVAPSPTQSLPPVAPPL